jgi:hypothetical protein
MSEVNFQVQCEFISVKARDEIAGLLSKFDAVYQKEPALLTWLNTLGIEEEALEMFQNCYLGEVTTEGKNSLQFNLVGGVAGGFHCWEILTDILQQSAAMIVSFGFNDQVGEYFVAISENGHQSATYETGAGGECDEEIYAAADSEEKFAICKRLYEEDKLEMPEEYCEEEEYEDDFDEDDFDEVDDDEDDEFIDDDDDEERRWR